MSYNGISFLKKIIDPSKHLRTTGRDDVEIEEKIAKNDPVSEMIRYLLIINEF